MKNYLLGLAAVGLLASCDSKQESTEMTPLQKDVQAYIDSYTTTYVGLAYAANKADWKANTYIVEGDTATANAVTRAYSAMAAFTGSVENIEKAREYLVKKDSLLLLQVKQLDRILYEAGANPQTVKEIVDEKIKADNKQNTDLFGFTFMIDGDTVSTNDIDDILKKENDLSRRLKAWAASKEVGVVLKDGLENLQRLRNQTVQALGYSDYFTYQVSDYGISTEEMMELMLKINRELRPLFSELHTWARYELAERYGQPVPEMIPAHWLPNRWGQDWSELVQVEGVNLDSVIASKGAEWITKQAERFYVSLGFDSLPKSFYELSDLYPLPEGAKYSKNNHASAWHLDLDRDVRSLMSVEANTEWYETVHHELGHIYYYMLYSTPDVPPLLREGANRAYHEAIGTQMGLAAMQKPFLEGLGLIPQSMQTDEMQTLLKEALNYAVFIPFSTGTMTSFEHDLYAENLPKDEYNARWWDYVTKFQGIVPPSPRGEEFCDAASKTHISNDAAQYYDYAISFVLLFQLHDHIAKNILHQDPHATNYYGSKEVGDFLRGILSKGGTVEGWDLLKETIGSDLSAKPMLDYFAPLMTWLKKQNEGRNYTLGEL
jgi:peptidyl-dipeptidase A